MHITLMSQEMSAIDLSLCSSIEKRSCSMIRGWPGSQYIPFTRHMMYGAMSAWNLERLRPPAVYMWLDAPRTVQYTVFREYSANDAPRTVKEPGQRSWIDRLERQTAENRLDAAGDVTLSGDGEHDGSDARLEALGGDPVANQPDGPACLVKGDVVVCQSQILHGGCGEHRSGTRRGVRNPACSSRSPSPLRMLTVPAQPAWNPKATSLRPSGPASSS